MSAPGIDPRVLDALQSASSLELFQLSTLIERLLADPRRIIAVRKDMHLGQTVRFVDWRDGSLRQGKVVAMRETQVTLQDLRERKEWKLPYAAIEPPHPDPAAPPQALAPEPPAAPLTAQPALLAPNSRAAAAAMVSARSAATPSPVSPSTSMPDNTAAASSRPSFRSTI